MCIQHVVLYEEKKKQVIYELENLVLNKNKCAAQDLNFNKINFFFKSFEMAYLAQQVDYLRNNLIGKVKKNL